MCKGATTLFSRITESSSSLANCLALKLMSSNPTFLESSSSITVSGITNVLVPLSERVSRFSTLSRIILVSSM